MRRQNTNETLCTDDNEERMVYVSFPFEGIAVAGYDPQCERLIIRFEEDDFVHEFWDIPEHVWYNMRKVESVVRYLKSCIAGKCDVSFQKKLKNKVFSEKTKKS